MQNKSTDPNRFLNTKLIQKWRSLNWISSNRSEMGDEKDKKSLTVAPFECAWHEELRFREAGRGCISFEAFAQNDVTLVFREQVGSQHYHYKMDNSPNYTIILGSHRNRRLKIEVDGKTVVDVAGVGLCCSSSFQSYWISIYDGLISIGNGRHPFKNVVFQWRDTHPNYSVQYVGLSSWDKHVGYRNVSVLPSSNDHSNPWNHIDYKEHKGENEGEGDGNNMSDSFEKWGLMNYLESWEFSDVLFVVGNDKKAVPAHKVILAASGEFSFNSHDDNIIYLPSTTYSVFHAFLEFIYAGQTQIVEPQIGCLLDLGIQFQISLLVKHCEDIVDRFKKNKKLFDSSKKTELTSRNYQEWQSGDLPEEQRPIMCNLKKFLQNNEHSDVSIYIEGHGFLTRPHKLILSAWSEPLAKMFTNGMSESSSSEISFSDVSPKAFEVMLNFMYGGVLEMDKEEMSSLLIPVLILSDQFGVAMLQQECCKYLFEYLSEGTVCPILQAISSLPSCKLLEERCKKFFAKHFDYCTAVSADFTSLDEEIFKDILQHADMTVTSEEKVLDAILTWCMQADEVCNWRNVDELLLSLSPEQIFRERLSSVDFFLAFVRFPLMSSPLLQKMEKSNLSRKISLFQHLVEEAIQFSITQVRTPCSYENVRFQHRRSSFKELQYICDGDKNGVIYFAGTSYGKHQWVNPVLAKKIYVTSSSPASRYTDPKALVSRTYQGTSFAGPRTVNGQNCSWWMIDIGLDHQLICNYYTLRQDGSTAYPRSWAFQGSMDGENWSNLRVHENEQTICRPGQYASWPVHGSAALLPFRFFRVLLTAPTSDESNLWNFSICFLELYGFFH